jgi:hypothetical protein
MERIFLWWDELDDFVHAARHLVAVTASEIVQVILRRSIPIYCGGLAGMVGLGCLLIFHPTDYAMPVFLACMALLVIISQMITWGVTARAAGRASPGRTPAQSWQSASQAKCLAAGNF